MRNVFSHIDTETPKLPSASPLSAVNMEDSTQILPSAGRYKYTVPRPFKAPGAPIRMKVPYIATDDPKRLPAPLKVVETSERSVQDKRSVFLTKTYAIPALVEDFAAPITVEFFHIESAHPNLSPACPSPAVKEGGAI